MSKVQNFQIVEASGSSEYPVPQNDFEYIDYLKKAVSPKRKTKKQENDKKLIQSQGLADEQEDISDLLAQS